MIIVQPLNRAVGYVCPADRFHESIDLLVIEAKALGLDGDQMRGDIILQILWLLVPAGHC